MPEFRDLEIGEHERDPLPIVGDGAVANKEVTVVSWSPRWFSTSPRAPTWSTF